MNANLWKSILNTGPKIALHANLYNPLKQIIIIIIIISIIIIIGVVRNPKKLTLIIMFLYIWPIYLNPTCLSYLFFLEKIK